MYHRLSDCDSLSIKHTGDMRQSLWAKRETVLGTCGCIEDLNTGHAEDDPKLSDDVMESVKLETT